MFFFGGGSNLNEMDVKQVHEAIQAKGKDALLLDVRSEGEYAQARVEGSKLISLAILAYKHEDIKDYKDKDVYIICRSGQRSRSACDILTKAGFTSVYNVTGGIMSWGRAGLPVAS
ncbi:MAG: rhodanese-like domain-containing protein [SAR324 cluster bacterium]|nr:rhodanese-like domain-containing protein [SAR324 cluster bacterium]